MSKLRFDTRFDSRLPRAEIESWLVTNVDGQWRLELEDMLPAQRGNQYLVQFESGDARALFRRHFAAAPANDASSPGLWSKVMALIRMEKRNG